MGYEYRFLGTLAAPNDFLLFYCRGSVQTRPGRVWDAFADAWDRFLFGISEFEKSSCVASRSSLPSRYGR
jgi:hypothetical protein